MQIILISTLARLPLYLPLHDFALSPWSVYYCAICSQPIPGLHVHDRTWVLSIYTEHLIALKIVVIVYQLIIWGVSLHKLRYKKRKIKIKNKKYLITKWKFILIISKLFWFLYYVNLTFIFFKNNFLTFKFLYCFYIFDYKKIGKKLEIFIF